MKHKVLSLLLFGAMLLGFYACDDPIDPFNGHEYVDLGLPSGTLWATCNVGATNPEDAGDYFSWGETRPKENYDWTNEGDYQWGVDYWGDNTNYGMTKYNPTDGKTVLEAADDAAATIWGGDWRIPTKVEFQELLDECDWEWDTRKLGYIITSKGNNKSIFLPAMGHREGTNEPNSVGVLGCYWCSVLNLDIDKPLYAYALLFDSNYQNTVGHYRCIGFSIRPVCSKKT